MEKTSILLFGMIVCEDVLQEVEEIVKAWKLGKKKEMYCDKMCSRGSVKDFGHKGGSYSTQTEQKDAAAGGDGDDDDDATEGEGGERRQRLN